MNKQTTPRMSMLLIAMLAQFSVSHLAQAESANDWGNWADNSDTPSNVAFNYTPSTNNNNNNNQNTNNPNAQPTPDQTRTATNGGNLITETTAAGGWVGYALYGSYTSSPAPANCINCTSTQVVTADNKVANLTLNPQPAQASGSNVVQQVVPTLNGPGGPIFFPFLPAYNSNGKLTIASDVAAFNMSFDSANNIESSDLNSYFAFNNTEFGQPSSFNGSVGNRTSNYFANSMSDGYFGNININRQEQSGLNSINTSGVGYFGKVTPAADIAYLVAQNYQSYSLNGSSYMGGSVNILVNFANATWQGEFGGARQRYFNPNNNSFDNLRGYNAFDASGTISGATLTGTAVGQHLSNDVFDVQSGSVKGTLVGIANAQVENLGVVGAATLNVGASPSSTTVVNDVFLATPSRAIIIDY